jgi:hypothetical protein
VAHFVPYFCAGRRDEPMTVTIEAPHYLKDLKEREFQDLIVEAAVLNGYLTYHTHDSRRSDPGFPDLVCVKPGRPILFLEVKTERGKVSAIQQMWIETINETEGTALAMVVRPRDWLTLLEVLV